MEVPISPSLEILIPLPRPSLYTHIYVYARDDAKT